MNNEDRNESIAKKYSHEIHDIAYKLNKLEKGNIYEKTGARMDGYLATNIQQLRDMIIELLSKIEEKAPSVNDELRKALKDFYSDDE